MYLPPFELIKRVLLAGLGRARHPFKLNYVVTKECHSRCGHCSIWKSPAKNELSLAEIRSFVRENPYFTWVNFTGGEPTDRRDFVDVVREFNEGSKKLTVAHFPTNGLKPERVRDVVGEIIKFMPHGLRVTVSIDGPPEVNDRLRGIKGDFQSAIATLKYLREFKSGCAVFVGMTAYPTNHKFIFQTYAAIKEHLPDFSFQNFHVNLGNISQHFYENGKIKSITNPEMIASMREYRQARGLIKSPLDWVENRFMKLSESFIVSGVTPAACQAMYASIFVNETGTVYPCTIWGHPLGELREHNYRLEPILTAAKSQSARQMIQEKKCAQCWTPCEAYQSIIVNAVSEVLPKAFLPSKFLPTTISEPPSHTQSVPKVLPPSKKTG